MPFAFPNRVRFSTATTGTGSISVGTVVSGFQTPGTAGVPSGSTVGYGIADGANWEVGVGTFQPGLITRDVVEASSSGGAKISLSGSAEVYITATGGLLAPLWDNRGRNKLVNPLFKIQQRGTGPWTTNASYTADRWLLLTSNDTVSASIVALTDTQRSAVGDEELASGIQITITGNGAAGAFTAFSQRIEDVRRLAGRTVTISFYATAAASFKIGASIDQNFGSGGSPSATVTGNGAAVTLGTSLARYSITLAVPSIIGKTVGSTANTDYTQVNLWLSAGSSNATRAGSVGVQSGAPVISGVALEIGGVATPLEKPDPALDLEACERFYRTGSGTVTFYTAATSTNWWTPVPFPVTMRAAPTMAVTPSGGASYSGVTGVNAAVGGFVLQAVTSAIGIGSYNYNYTATAEL